MKLASSTQACAAVSAAWDTYCFKIATTHFAVCCPDIERAAGLAPSTRRRWTRARELFTRGLVLFDRSLRRFLPSNPSNSSTGRRRLRARGTRVPAEVEGADAGEPRSAPTWSSSAIDHWSRANFSKSCRPDFAEGERERDRGSRLNPLLASSPAPGCPIATTRGMLTRLLH